VRSHRGLRPLILCLLSLAATSALGAATSALAATGSGAVTVELGSLSPAIAVKGSTLHLAGKVVGGSSGHGNVTVRLAVADMQVRSDLDTDAGNGARQVYGHDDVVGALASGATADWSLTMPVSALSLTSNSVYALDVEAYAAGQRVGAVRTYLPYAMTGDTGFKATQAVVLLPVTATPALDGQADKDVPESVHDDLSAQFATGGRLQSLLATAAATSTVTVSWAVDPDLLATAESESHGYSLYPSGTSGVGAQNAANWLAEAKNVLGTDGELWQLPATDPDLGSLGKAKANLARAAITESVALTGTTVGDLAGRTPKGTLAWPADGQIDAATLNVADGLKPAAVITDSDSIDLHTPQDSYTPTGRASAADGTPLAVSDAALDATFNGDAQDAAAKGSDRTLLATQRLLAQTALIALERPNLETPRTIMITGARGTLPNSALLSAIGQASWLKSVGLSTLLGAHVDAKAQTGVPKRAAATAAADLTTAQLAATSGLNSSMDALASILTTDSQAADQYAPATLRTLSTAWRSSAAAQQAFTAAVRGRLETTMNAVSLVQKSDLTLSGKDGVIPFTIENHFDTPVDIGIRITTDHAGLNVQTVTLQTAQQGTNTVKVHVSSAVSGTRVVVTAQLVTPDGRDYGAPQSFQVTVSSIGSVTLVIFALSATLLVVAVGLRIYRSRRARPAAVAAVPSGESADNAAAAEAERGQ
jgi:hypothetical protein